jgi:hypothetical protein
MISKLGRIAGVGTDLAFVESEEVYKNRWVSVKLPHEHKEQWEKLSGPVVVKRLEDIE